MLSLEDLSEEDLESLKAKYSQLAERARRKDKQGGHKQTRQHGAPPVEADEN